MQKFMRRTSYSEIHAQNFMCGTSCAEFMYGIGQTALPDPFFSFYFAPSISFLLPRSFHFGRSALKRSFQSFEIR